MLKSDPLCDKPQNECIENVANNVHTDMQKSSLHVSSPQKNKGSNVPRSKDACAKVSANNAKMQQNKEISKSASAVSENTAKKDVPRSHLQKRTIVQIEPLPLPNEMVVISGQVVQNSEEPAEWIVVKKILEEWVSEQTVMYLLGPQNKCEETIVSKDADSERDANNAIGNELSQKKASSVENSHKETNYSKKVKKFFGSSSVKKKSVVELVCVFWLFCSINIY